MMYIIVFGWEGEFMSVIKKIVRTLCLLLSIFIVVGILGYGLFGVDTMNVENNIEVIQTNSHSVTLKRAISEDIYMQLYLWKHHL